MARSRLLVSIGSALAVAACALLIGARSPHAGEKASKVKGDAAVAYIGDVPLTLEDVDARAAGRLMKVRQQEYEVRKQVLDGLINDQLLEREAAEKEVSREKLLESEVSAKVSDPTEAEIDRYYNQNKKRYGAATKEQVSPKIVSALRAQKMGQLQRVYLKSLRDKYGVRVVLEPPRVSESLADDDASKGPDRAPVTIVEFSDYQCRFCRRAEATVDAVLKRYGDKVRVVYRDYPLSFHQNARTASEAAECAKEQGKFWEMHQAMFADQAKLASAQLIETAGSIGLDSGSFKECLESGKYKAEVQKDFADGQKYGVTGTPTFFINGIMMVGAKGIDAFVDIIDQELQRNP